MTARTIEVTLTDGRKELVADVDRVDMRNNLVAWTEGKPVFAVAIGSWQSWKVVPEDGARGVYGSVVNIDPVEEEVLSFVRLNAGCSTRDVMDAVHTNSGRVRDALVRLHHWGFLTSRTTTTSTAWEATR